MRANLRGRALLIRFNPKPVPLVTDFPPPKRRRVDEDPDSNLCALYSLFWGKPESPLHHTHKVKIPHHLTLETEGEGSDFTIIKLPEGVTFPFGGSTMLVPEIYKTFWDLVVKDDLEWQKHQGTPEPHTFITHSTIISGQPGIGQQCFFRLLFATQCKLPYRQDGLRKQYSGLSTPVEDGYDFLR